MTALPDSLQHAIHDLVLPVDPPEDAERVFEIDGTEMRMRRRDAQIRVDVPGRDAEDRLRQAFGHDNDTVHDSDAASVTGFITVEEWVGGDRFDKTEHEVEAIDRVSLRIDRATLIVNAV